MNVGVTKAFFQDLATPDFFARKTVLFASFVLMAILCAIDCETGDPIHLNELYVFPVAAISLYARHVTLVILSVAVAASLHLLTLASYQLEHIPILSDLFVDTTAVALVALLTVGVKTQYLAVRKELSERKRGQVALEQSEQRFRAILEQSIAAIYVIQDDRLVYVNRRMREIFGYAPDDVFDPNPLAHVKEIDRPKVVDQMRRRLSGEDKGAYAITALRKDGSEFTFGVHGARATYDGRPGILVIAQDITEREVAQEETRRYVEKLQQALTSTVAVIATIGEMRDPYTQGHERRVGEVAAALAIEMGLDTNRVEGIRRTGYLHDVGKIGVPAEILSKPTRLSSLEFELVKGHAQQSYEILKEVDFPWPVAEIALQHHERLDGSGYPRGLKGDAILLDARIISVADVLEAMASHRPYRPGLGIDKALAEIERGRGTVYDANVADACLRLFRERAYKLPV
jgi:PAS domain S-box-containing protein